MALGMGCRQEFNGYVLVDDTFFRMDGTFDGRICACT